MTATISYALQCSCAQRQPMRVNVWVDCGGVRFCGSCGHRVIPSHAPEKIELPEQIGGLFLSLLNKFPVQIVNLPRPSRQIRYGQVVDEFTVEFEHRRDIKNPECSVPGESINVKLIWLYLQKDLLGGKLIDCEPASSSPPNHALLKLFSRLGYVLSESTPELRLSRVYAAPQDQRVLLVRTSILIQDR